MKVFEVSTRELKTLIIFRKNIGEIWRYNYQTERVYKKVSAKKCYGQQQKREKRVDKVWNAYRGDVNTTHIDNSPCKKGSYLSLDLNSQDKKPTSFCWMD
jgi:hypothetical protein